MPKPAAPSPLLAPTPCKLVCRAVSSTADSAPWLESVMLSSHAEVRGGVCTTWGLASASALGFCFLDTTVFLGCDATRPLDSGVPVMKTRSRS